MRIFLIYPNINSLLNTNYNYGLGYISAVLRKAGHNVTYITLKNAKHITTLYQHIRTQNPQIIAFSATTSQFNYVKAISETIRTFSNSITISFNTKHCLKCKVFTWQGDIFHYLDSKKLKIMNL